MNKKDIKKYFSFLGIKKKYKSKKINCEICGSKDSKIIKKKISWNNNKFGILPVCGCLNCGFVFQNPRFEKDFYEKFYSEYYRKKTYNNVVPSKAFLKDQENRGKKIFDFIKKYIKKSKGTILDVGCSVGLMFKPFIKSGWTCIGNDPDYHYVKYGREKLNLPVEFLQAEKMKLKNNSLDLIIIAGSLEHCYDPNKVLTLCAKAAKKGSLIVLETRGEPRATSKVYFNHNHHRYFSMNSIELMMIKHGWKPFLTTLFPISGPTREGGIWSLGIFTGKKSKKNFKDLIKNGKRESYESLINKYKYYDLINKKIDPNRGDYRNK